MSSRARDGVLRHAARDGRARHDRRERRSPTRAGTARRTLRARHARVLRRLRLAVVRAPRRASATRTCSRSGTGVEADEPVPLDHRRAHDDDPHGPARSASTASTNGSFYLPKVDRIIAPLLFSFAGDALPNTLLAHGLSAGDVFPDGDFYPTLSEAGVAAHVALPFAVAASTPGGMLLQHTAVHPFSEIGGGVAGLGEALGRDRSGLRVRLPARRRHGDAQAGPGRIRTSSGSSTRRSPSSSRACAADRCQGERSC